jgi:Outer membrane protein beta-barrel domain
MKKLVFFVFTTGVFFTASAQIQFGVKAGANFATLTGTGSNGATTKVDFHGGGFAQIPLVNSFFLKPELVYSRQGAKATSDGVVYNINQNYLNIPVLAKYQHSSGLHGETGPQLGFLLAANVSSGGSSQDVKSSYKSTDFSWAFGVGYKIPLINAGIDARYNLGLSNIAATQVSGYSVKNSVFQLGVFYVFGGL